MVTELKKFLCDNLKIQIVKVVIVTVVLVAVVTVVILTYFSKNNWTPEQNLSKLVFFLVLSKLDFFSLVTV